jgi:hypothetical protein
MVCNRICNTLDMSEDEKKPATTDRESLPYLFKGKSINSKRLREIAETSGIEESNLSHKSRRRNKKKIARMDAIAVNCLGKDPVVKDWDGKSTIYMDGKGDGLPSHAKPGVAIFDAKSASLVVVEDSGAFMNNVFCLLPRADVEGIFSKQSHAAFVSLESVTKTTDKSRGICRNPQGTRKYMTMGTKASRAARGVVDGMGALRTIPSAHKEISRILKKIEHVSAKWIGTMELKSVEAAKKAGKYPGFSYHGNAGEESKIWPSMACGKNTFLPMHTDSDYFLSAGSIHCRRRTGSNVLQYFCFPTIGVSVGMRNGDVILFNPSIPHCISSPCFHDYECFAMSAYLKSLVVSGNSNIAI